MQEESAAKEVVNAAPTTPETPKKEQTFGETIDFFHLCRVKGKKPLFFPRSYANKSGIVAMEEFFGSQICYPVTEDIERLSDFRFYKEDGKVITMTEVFDNLNNKFGELLDLEVNPDIMEIMVPGYDKEKFKSHHAIKVLNWYLEIREKIKLNQNGKEKEQKEEKTS